MSWSLFKIFCNNFLPLLPKFPYCVTHSWIKQLDSEFIIIYIAIPLIEVDFVDRVAYALDVFDRFGAKDDFDVLLCVKDDGTLYKNDNDQLLFFVFFVQCLQNKAF